MAGAATLMSIPLLDALSWTYAWLLLLLPLPWLCWRFLSPVQQPQAVAHIPFAADWGEISASSAPPANNKTRLLMLSLIWLCLLLAAARPEWHGDAVELPVSGRDLVLAVDISGSMRMQDFNLNGQQVDRLTATKAVADAFIQRREGDRVGLILFGTQAYVQTPLTFDRQTVRILLNESAIGLAGKATAIGDTIALAVKRMQQSSGASGTSTTLDRVLILLTDGVNTAGAISPQQATELAVTAGLKIYTIGIGADSMTVGGFFGSQQINPSAELDEKGLTSIAEQTGGQYFRARDTDQLNRIYHIIDQLEPVERERDMFRPVHALFMWPLGFALLLAIFLLASMLPWSAAWKR
ncbi:MAG: VWA domain-containing protein [Mariprofundus sp.]|nr:VWA domain-containing protein [Mariprofundus sp.]